MGHQEGHSLPCVVRPTRRPRGDRHVPELSGIVYSLLLYLKGVVFVANTFLWSNSVFGEKRSHLGTTGAAYPPPYILGTAVVVLQLCVHLIMYFTCFCFTTMFIIYIVCVVPPSILDVILLLLLLLSSRYVRTCVRAPGVGRTGGGGQHRPKFFFSIPPPCLPSSCTTTTVCVIARKGPASSNTCWQTKFINTYICIDYIVIPLLFLPTYISK